MGNYFAQMGIMSSPPLSPPQSEKQYSGRKGLVGLRNLGNTCYMNSGLQCLSNTKQITDYFMSTGFVKDINTSNPLGTKGNLACSYAQLIRQLWAGEDDVVSPFKLKKIIGKVATQFSGYGQQDSQQFISYLIDGLQEDLNLVKKKQNFETKDDIVPDEQASTESERNYAKRVQSYIRDLMVGQFKSTVKCLTCHKISICFDPYMLVTLPIPTPKISQVFIVDNDLSHGAIKLVFEISQQTTIKQLDNQIRREYKNLKRILYVKIDRQEFEVTRMISNFEQTIFSITRQNEILFAYELPQADPETDIYFTEFYFQKSRCSFPRFLKFQKRNWEKYHQQIVQQSYHRVSQKSYDTVVQDVKKIQPNQTYGKICDKLIIINFKKDMKLLTYKENRDFSFKTSQSRNTNLYDCLSYFSKPEILEKQNQWYCNKCKHFMPAEKQLEIYKSNKILVLAFKRFTRLKKIKTLVDFPIEGFDIGPYLRRIFAHNSDNKEKKPVLYDLYGVVNHYGSLQGGHYTAFCQNFLNKKYVVFYFRWYQFNDSRVSQINPKQIVSDSSYVLFFRRRN